MPGGGLTDLKALSAGPREEEAQGGARTMARILLVNGHPDPEPDRLCAGLARAYAEGAREAGHTVDEITLGALDVPFLRGKAAFERGEPPGALRPFADGLRRCDHLALAFPLWLGGPPGLLKAALEQTFRPGVAFEYLPRGRTRSLLAGRSARLMVTMGMPAAVYRLVFLSHGVRAVSRGVLGFTGFSPVRETLFGSVAAASEATRAGWLAKARCLGAAAA
jgi:putative NADPH-quinone reductase